MRRDALFAGGELRARLTVAEKELRNEVRGIDAASLLGTDPAELAAYLADKYRFDVPRLMEEGIYVDEPQEARVDVSGDWDRAIGDRSQPFYISGTTFTYHIPFEGDEELLLLQPSSMTTIWPEGTVRNQEIVWGFTSARPQDLPTPHFQRNLELIKKYIGWVEADTAPYHTALPGRARAVVEERRQRLFFDRDRAAQLGYPIRRRADAPDTYRVPTVPKRPVRPPAPATKPAGWQPEPAMAMEVYEDVLRVVTNMVEVIERSPATFRTLDEEALRDHFLVQLNGQYEGGASGETFNHQGKTDILLRLDGRVIFVAECKFWDGPKSILKAITQVLSYLSWHDTKAALLVFHRGRNLTAVLAKIPEGLRSHPAHVRDLPYDSTTGFRFLLRHPEDQDREVTLTILAFQIPTDK